MSGISHDAHAPSGGALDGAAARREDFPARGFREEVHGIPRPEPELSTRKYGETCWCRCTAPSGTGNRWTSFGALVDAYPEALMFPSYDDGFLPLHVAALYGAASLDVVRFLVYRCPQALEGKRQL